VEAAARPAVRAPARAVETGVGMGRPRRRDYAEQFVAPVLAGAVTWWINIRISPATGAALLTLAGLFAAFLFQLVIQLLDRAASWADTKPETGPLTSHYAALLTELSANAAYASLVAAVAATTSLGATISSKGWQERLLAAIAVALLVHLGTTLRMVTRRVFLLTKSRLHDARTGAHLDNA